MQFTSHSVIIFMTAMVHINAFKCVLINTEHFKIFLLCTEDLIFVSQPKWWPSIQIFD
jgi:hypothetical protein